MKLLPAKPLCGFRSARRSRREARRWSGSFHRICSPKRRSSLASMPGSTLCAVSQMGNSDLAQGGKECPSVLPVPSFFPQAQTPVGPCCCLHAATRRSTDVHCTVRIVLPRSRHVVREEERAARPERRRPLLLSQARGSPPFLRQW